MMWLKPSLTCKHGDKVLDTVPFKQHTNRNVTGRAEYPDAKRIFPDLYQWCKIVRIEDLLEQNQSTGKKPKAPRILMC